MIIIRPIHTSTLSADNYTIKLPSSIYPVRARGMEIATALDGTAIVTAWDKNNTGAQSSVSVTIEPSEFDKLETLVNADTSMMVSSMSKLYKCVVDISAVERVFSNLKPRVRCSVVFTIVEVIK